MIVFIHNLLSSYTNNKYNNSRRIKKVYYLLSKFSFINDITQTHNLKVAIVSTFHYAMGSSSKCQTMINNNQKKQMRKEGKKSSNHRMDFAAKQCPTNARIITTFTSPTIIFTDGPTMGVQLNQLAIRFWLI